MNYILIFLLLGIFCSDMCYKIKSNYIYIYIFVYPQYVLKYNPQEIDPSAGVERGTMRYV